MEHFEMSCGDEQLLTNVKYQLVKNANIWASRKRYLKATQLKMNAEMLYVYLMK